MSQYEVNEDAVAKARSMIKAHHYVLESSWSDAQPSTDRENDYLRDHDWHAFGQWHLALDDEASKETKDRYGFLIGDFQRIHRSGLIAAKQRAAQNDHTEVEKAADDLLELLDEIRAS